MLKIFRTIRPVNLLMIILLYHLFMLLEYRYGLFNKEHFLSILLYALSVTCIMAGGYFINDYYDSTADSINNPNKSTMAPNHLIIGFSVCSIMGLLIPILFNESDLLLMINALSIFLLWFYSAFAQKLPLLGNLIVAGLIGIQPFLYLVLKGDYFSENRSSEQSSFLLILLFFSLLAFLINFYRELIKDIEDMDGDKIAGYKTLPLVTSVETSKITGLFILMITSYLLYQFYLQYNYFSQTSSISFLIFACTPIVAIIPMTVLAKEKRDFSKLSLWSKIAMLSGFVYLALQALTI